jgi:protein-disulfide isomerase
MREPADLNRSRMTPGGWARISRQLPSRRSAAGPHFSLPRDAVSCDMRRIMPALMVLPAVVLMACSQPAAQSQQEVEALRKEVESLKRDMAEVREFLKLITKGAFGGPRLEDATIDITGAPANGEPSAKLTLVEVSDYHCPFCRRHFQQTQPQIYSEYVNTGKVRHVFVHYPIDQLHPDAYRSHEAASCAADQGKFWELHSKLFQTPAKTTEQILAVAGTAGLDTGALKACMDAGTHSQAVRESVARLQKLGADSTPIFLIGATPAGGEPLRVLKVVKGAHPFKEFKSAIDGLLQ